MSDNKSNFWEFIIVFSLFLFIMILCSSFNTPIYKEKNIKQYKYVDDSDLTFPK